MISDIEVYKFFTFHQAKQKINNKSWHILNASNQRPVQQSVVLMTRLQSPLSLSAPTAGHGTSITPYAVNAVTIADASLSKRQQQSKAEADFQNLARLRQTCGMNLFQGVFIHGGSVGVARGSKGPEYIFNKIIEENFPNLKKDIPMKVQEAYRTLNRLDQKKSPLAI